MAGVRRKRIPIGRLLKSAYLLLLVGALIIHATPPDANAVSLWFAGEPEITSTDRVLNYQDFYDFRASKNGHDPGVVCIDKKIAKRKIGSWSMQYEDTCWYRTEIGLISKSGNYLLQPGTDVAGRIVNSSLDSRVWPMFLPTPNADVFLELVANPVGTGYYLAFRHIDDMNFERVEGNFGTATLKIQGPSTYEPYNENVPSYARRFTIRLDELWWSSDGNYMLVARDGFLWRFNLKTHKVIGTRLAQYPGFHTTDSAAITSSGRYAAHAVETAEPSTDIAMVDFESCTVGESPVVNVARTCQTRSFKSLLKQHTSFTSTHLPRFYGEHTLGIYLYDKNQPGNGFKQLLLQASGTEFESSDYVALGDSFSSGEGADDYEPGTDVIGKNMCHTSRNSYPYLINQQLNLTDFLSVACSGASTENFWRKGQYEPINPTDEYKLPGLVRQREVIDKEVPNIVTITMSGNDIGFKEKFEYCLVWSSDCYSSYEKRKQIAEEIRDLHKELIGMYEQIMSNPAADTHLYVLGYPQIISNNEGVSCGVNIPMNTYQRNMANDLITYFNAVIKSAAARAGAYYVGTENTLNGHRLCDDVSATMAVNGITVGNDTGVWKLRFLNNGTFHPNQLGHQLLKSAVLERTSSLTVPMPPPDKSEPIPNPEDYPFLDVPSNKTEVIRKLYYNPETQPSLWKIGADVLIKVTNPAIPIPPFTTFDVFLHSKPVKIGQVRSDGAGLINSLLKLPTDISPGMHELHIQGFDENGNPIDVYKFVYVAYSENDFDGDGVLNEDEPCGIIQASEQDADNDGIDDACDPLIVHPKPGSRDPSGTVSGEKTNNRNNGSPFLLDTASENDSNSNNLQTSEQQDIEKSQNDTKAVAGASSTPSSSVGEKLNKMPLGQIFIGIGIAMSTLTLIYYLRYAKG